jgi:UDP-N-acetyl-D-mannosaminuronic acid transferase (WecB/TagA/CpsF family)
MTRAMTSKHHVKPAKLSEAEPENSTAPVFDITVRDLINKMTIASDESARLQIQNELVNTSCPKILGFLNAHAVNLCWSDMVARRSFASADVLLRDGAGMAILCRRLGMPPGLNMNGTDFIPELLASRSGIRVALFGSDATASVEAANVLRRRGVDVISAIDGFQLPERYIADACEKKPEMIVLAMGFRKN